MFKLLKEKLKQGRKSISDKIEEEGTTEETEIETTVEPEKKGFFSKLKDKFSHKAGIEDIKEEETVEQEVKIKDEVEEYQKKYSNLKLNSTEEKETIYKAWNRGIKAATGKYITNANTDDRHRKDALEILSNELDADENTTLVYADAKVTQTEKLT